MTISPELSDLFFNSIDAHEAVGDDELASEAESFLALIKAVASYPEVDSDTLVSDFQNRL